jgi:hypothetical protein
MSDGLSDANAVGQLAVDLREAAHVTREAIEAAEAGHRGLSVDVCGEFNDVLRRFGLRYELRRLS